MSHPISRIWLSPPKDLVSRVTRCIDSALDEKEKREGIVFFRADEAGQACGVGINMGGATKITK
jgi:hypothetical protein